MSRWHREHPELAGTDADPWMQHESYRRASAEIERIQSNPDAYAQAMDASDGQACSWCEERPAQRGSEWCAQCEERRHEYAADAEGDEDVS